MCPLVAAGDLRSGAQLLAQGDADAELHLPPVHIDNLILKLSGKCEELEQRLLAVSQPEDIPHMHSSAMPSHTRHNEGTGDHSRAVPAPTAATRPLTIGPSYPVGVVAGIVLNSAVEADYRRVAQQLSIGTPLVAGVRSGYPMEVLLEMIEPTTQHFKQLLKRSAEAMQVRGEGGRFRKPVSSLCGVAGRFRHRRVPAFDALADLGTCQFTLYGANFDRAEYVRFAVS